LVHTVIHERELLAATHVRVRLTRAALPAPPAADMVSRATAQHGTLSRADPEQRRHAGAKLSFSAGPPDWTSKRQGDSKVRAGCDLAWHGPGRATRSLRPPPPPILGTTARAAGGVAFSHAYHGGTVAPAYGSNYSSDAANPCTVARYLHCIFIFLPVSRAIFVALLYPLQTFFLTGSLANFSKPLTELLDAFVNSQASYSDTCVPCGTLAVSYS
jgi:hypothetical protein